MTYIEAAIRPIPTAAQLRQATKHFLEGIRQTRTPRAWVLELESLEPSELEHFPDYTTCAELIGSSPGHASIHVSWALGPDWYMSIDDVALLAESAILNPLATALYGTGSPICNKALLIHTPNQGRRR